MLRCLREVACQGSQDLLAPSFPVVLFEQLSHLSQGLVSVLDWHIYIEEQQSDGLLCTYLFVLRFVQEGGEVIDDLLAVNEHCESVCES